ncbi:acyl-CoA dehydrogenase family protein [Tomitella fengzijianii]|uniref:Hydroxylase n=1 Tax=Tomitella fengzijianii TaxID=2597660 RepID=A0A516X6E2_9ACTN|nr:acyl-CoA dehydrogenase family protein [Tomitella fengzijianii]QDQ98610.1 hydroxylase [Tomitella fengzijianii]
MGNKVLEYIEEHADELFAQGAEAEKIGKLTDKTVQMLVEADAMRMLQPSEYGGLEYRPRQFAETVMRLASLDPAAGWVLGVCGVHPWQLAYNDERVREEVWGEDSSIWMASPYMPGGMLTPRGDGTYDFSGRWSFSSGTDHCRWAFLGAMLANPDGSMAQPPQMVHVIVPRGDYEIIDDSWDVVGLRGTGSKDLVIKGSVVPEYRTMTWEDVSEGTGQDRSGRTETLYQMPWSAMFPMGITAATIGICEGLLRLAEDYQAERIDANGAKIKDDPYTMYEFGELTADLRAARAELLANADRFWDITESGRKATFAERAQGRATQVRAAWRAVEAANAIYARCGGNALRMDKPMQRFWRDAQAGIHHAIHSPNTVYHAATLSSLGADPQGPLRKMI